MARRRADTDVPDWWLVQPTVRRHTVPPEIKRALAQAAIEYVAWLDAKAIEQGRRHEPPILPPRPSSAGWSRRLAPAVTLRRKANSAARTPAQRAWEERDDWRMVETGVTGSVRFCSLVAAGVRFHPPTFCLLQIFSRIGASLPHETARAAQALTMAGKKGRSGRRKGSLNWSKTPAALAGHYLNDLIETWLAGVPIPTRPDWWVVQPTGREQTVPPEIKAQVAIKYVVRLGPPITRPSQVLAWSRRLAPAVTLRHKANRGRRRRGHGRSGSYDWRIRGKPGATGPVRFCSLVAGGVEFHPPTF